MKKFCKEFLFRGLLCASGGPIVLAIIYGILGSSGSAEAIPATEVCLGIVTITLLAFVAAGMTAIYQMEQLPLPMMILLHGGGLYIAYIIAYLINGWLQKTFVPILVFTGIFAAGYAVIWLIIYSITKAKTEALNKKLKSNP